ncbi:unnamed protein product [Strongylus vulgaris]|uniref:Uncharacterized protein n=1 Tax=Strongylus vulgaris TaxID=40348 RepID=A0A3P7JNC2_STRVU|nr:unnamed protein product [Strongylus vulgaris]
MDAYASIGDLAREDAPQVHALVDRGARSTLRVLRNGLEVPNELSSYFHICGLIS